MKDLLFLILLFFISSSAFAQTTLRGKVSDLEAGEIFIGANVVLFKKEKEKSVFVTGTSTDFDGNYKVTVEPGIYEVEVSYVGYPNVRVNEVSVIAETDNKLDVKLVYDSSFIIYCDFGWCGDYLIPLIERDNPTSKTTFLSEEIQNNANKNISKIAQNTPGISLQRF